MRSKSLFGSGLAGLGYWVRIEDRRVKASYLGLHAEVSRTGSEGLLGDRPRPCEPSSAPGGDRERLLRRDDAPVKSVRPSARVSLTMPRAPGAGSTISWALGLSTRHLGMHRFIPHAFSLPSGQCGKPWGACRITVIASPFGTR